MKKIILFILTILILIAACEQKPSDNANNGEVTNYLSLVDNLRASGLEVKTVDEIKHEFFSVKGDVISVNGQDVQVFEYKNQKEAEQDAKKISPDGTTIGTSIITWIDNPHFYRKENLIIISLGNNAKVNAALENIFGKQFAGFSEAKLEESYCTPEQKKAEVCIQIYDPVCGWFDPEKIQCIKYPCAQTFSNSCHACADEKVLYWTEGECPK